MFDGVNSYSFTGFMVALPNSHASKFLYSFVVCHRQFTKTRPFNFVMIPGGKELFLFSVLISPSHFLEYVSFRKNLRISSYKISVSPRYENSYTYLCCLPIYFRYLTIVPKRKSITLPKG